MPRNSPKVTIHMVSSLDGFIARSDGSVSWLESTDHYENGVTLTDKEIADFVSTIDCYVMGSRTYEHSLQLGWVYGDVPVVVLSRRRLQKKIETVEFYSGDLNYLINERLKAQYNNIWVVGGAMVSRNVICSDLADEIVISIMPIILGDGLTLFDHIGHERRLHLKETTAYRDGMIELSYEIIK